MRREMIKRYVGLDAQTAAELAEKLTAKCDALSGHGLAQACSLGEGRRKRERGEVCKGH